MRMARHSAVVLAALLLITLADTGTAQTKSPSPTMILESAADTCRSMTDPDERAGGLLRVGEAYADANLREQALAVLREAEAAAPECTGSTHILTRVGRMASRMGMADYALGLADQVEDDKAATQLLVEVAAELAAGDRAAEARGALVKACQRLQRVGHTEARVDLLAAAARQYQAIGDTEPATTLVQEAAELARGIPSAVMEGRALRGLTESLAELVGPAGARPVGDRIEVAGERFAALHRLAVLSAASGDEAAAAELEREANRIEEDVAPVRRARTLADLANQCMKEERGAAALDLLDKAESAAADIGSDEERTTVLQQLGMQYAALSHWDDAARLAARTNDPYSECKYRASAVLGLDALGEPEAALEMLSQLDRAYVKYVGHQRLNQLAEVYQRARPRAEAAEVLALEPVELRDRVMSRLAVAAAEAGSYEAALDWSETITSPARKREALLGAARAILRYPPADRVQSAIDVGFRVVEVLPGFEDQLEVLSLIAVRQVKMGEDQAVRNVLTRLQEHLDPSLMAETRAPARSRIAVVHYHLGESALAREQAERAVEEATGISCASCRTDVLAGIVEDALSLGDPEILQTVLAKLDVPSFQFVQCPRIVEANPNLTDEQKAALLQSALDGATQVLLGRDRVEALTQVAQAYAKAEVLPGATEARILGEALPVTAPLATRRLDMSDQGSSAANTAFLVYFTKPGCPSCEEAKQTIKKATERLSRFEVRTRVYDLTGSEEAVQTNKILCKLMDLPASDHMVAPSLFSVGSALVGDQITEERVALLIEGCVGLQAPWDRVAQNYSQGDPLLEQYSALKPLVVIAGGLADGINPCAFTVIIFFLSYLAYIGKSRREIVAVGVVFTIAVFATYFAVGLGLVQLIGIGHRWSTRFSLILQVVIAAMVLVAAILSVRDGVLCLKGRAEDMTLALSDSLKSRIRLTIARRARLGLTVVATAVLGALVALFELPCTGQVYFPIVAMLHRPGTFWGPAGWLLLYNVFFIVPLIIVFVAVLFGFTSEKLTALFRRHMAKAKFALAGVFAALFVVMVLQIA